MNQLQPLLQHEIKVSRHRAHVNVARILETVHFSVIHPTFAASVDRLRSDTT